MAKNLSLAARACLLMLFVNQAAAGFIFNDIRPRDYPKGRTLDIHVGHLISPRSVQKYPFYFLNWCHSKGVHHYTEGQENEPIESVEGVNMFDDELIESFFQYKVGQNKLNALPCNKNLTDEQIVYFSQLIGSDYRFRLYVDGLPSAVVTRKPDGTVQRDYQDGIPLGKALPSGEYALYNHWNIVIKTQPLENSKSMRIVGFEVEPRSFAQGETIDGQVYSAKKPLNLNKLRDIQSDDRQFAFTYSITTVTDSTTAYATRMDHYMKFGNENIHMAAILLSLGIIATLSCILVSLLKRGLNRDFLNILKQKMSSNQRRQERARLPREKDPEESRLTKKKTVVDAEDVAWKKLHADVFRTPAFPNIIACFMGAGFQVLAMMFTVLIAIVFAFAKTQWRPYIYTTMMVILALWGFLNGYTTSRTLKFFGTTDWNFSAIVAAFTLPLFISVTLGFELALAWLTRTALRYSFKANLLRIVGWYLLNGSMCYLGAYRGYMQKAVQIPSPVGTVRRPIPAMPYHMSILVVAPVLGFIQFASMYAEFSYLLDSVFRSHMYAMFGFLLLNMIMQVLIVSLLAILQTYVQLCYQNYEWWWRSFAIGAAGALWMAGYALLFLVTKMKVSDFAGDASFIVYIAVFIICYGCAAGAVAVNASYYFVSKIYSSIRKD